jgi:hypothetical protein
MRRCFILDNGVALRLKSGDHLNHQLQVWTPIEIRTFLTAL